MIKSASMHAGAYVSPRKPRKTAGCGLRKKFAKEETKEAALRETEVVTITHGTRITQQPRGEARAMVEGAPQRTHHQLKPGLPDLLPEAPRHLQNRVRDEAKVREKAERACSVISATAPDGPQNTIISSANISKNG